MVAAMRRHLAVDKGLESLVAGDRLAGVGVGQVGIAAGESTGDEQERRMVRQ